MSLAQDMLAKAGYKPEPAATTGAAADGAATTTGTTGAAAADTGAAATTDAATTTTDNAATTAQAGAATTDTTQAAGVATTDKTGGEGDAATAADTTATMDPDEAATLRVLQKKHGKTFASLDEALTYNPASASTQPAEPTEEEKQKLQERFQADAIKFGLDNNLFDTKALSGYHADKAQNPRDIALRVFTAEQLAADPALAEQMKGEDKAKARETIEERFKEAYFEFEEDTDWRKIRGQQLQKQVADGYLKSTYQNVLSATDTFENELRTRKLAGEYKANVDKVFAEIPAQLKISVEGKEYSYQVPENSRNLIREQFLKTETFKNFRNGDIDAANLRLAVEQAIHKTEMDKFIGQVAKSYHADKLEEIKLGRKGIPVTTVQEGTAQGATGSSAPEPSKAREQMARASKQPI